MAAEVTGRRPVLAARVRSAVPYRFRPFRRTGNAWPTEGGDLVIQQIDDGKVAEAIRPA